MIKWSRKSALLLILLLICSCTHEMEKTNSTEKTSDGSYLEIDKIDKDDENHVSKDSVSANNILLVEKILFNEECAREVEIALKEVDSSNMIFRLLQSNKRSENVVISYKSLCSNQDFTLNGLARPAILKIRTESSVLSKQLFSELIHEYEAFRNNEMISNWHWKDVQLLFKSGLLIFVENDMLFIVFEDHCGNETKFDELAEIIKQNFTKKNASIVKCGGNPTW